MVYHRLVVLIVMRHKNRLSIWSITRWWFL